MAWITSLTAGVTRGYVASAFARSACASRIGFVRVLLVLLSFSRRFVSVSFSSLSFSSRDAAAGLDRARGFGAAARRRRGGGGGRGVGAALEAAVAPLR